MALIDTHSIVEDLIAAGFAKSQAEALTRLKILHYEDLASKKDLENTERILRQDLETFKISVNQSINKVETEVAEIKTEVALVKNKIDTNFYWMKGIGMALLILGIKMAFFNS